MAYCDKLFEIERNIKELPPEQKYIKRQELSKPVLDDFFTWLNSFTPAKQSHLGNAVTYTLNQWPNLQDYLLDGRLDISNNSAEHLAKSFALCRKNFLFSNTPSGAEASATVMSMIETAKINKIDPFKYLTYIFETAPQLDMTKPENVERLLPDVYKNGLKENICLLQELFVQSCKIKIPIIASTISSILQRHFTGENNKIYKLQT